MYIFVGTILCATAGAAGGTPGAVIGGIIGFVVGAWLQYNWKT